MEAFVYTGQSARVIFGDGSIDQIAAEVRLLGIKRAMILSTPEQADLARDVSDRLRGLAVGLFTGATMHTPIEVTERAVAEVTRLEADGLVAVGGGSTTGLGKAIALRTDLPQLVLPTTYAGSEMTPILGETENGRKTTQRSARVLPETVIYDVSLTRSLPVGLSVVSGLNAVAHAVEALYAQDRNPVIDLMAEEAVAALAQALPGIVADPSNSELRSRALYGAWLCGICLGSVGMGLHHKLCHTLGGLFDLPHAPTHAVLLPYAMRYNQLAAPGAAGRVARALGSEQAASGLQQLAWRTGAPRSLAEIGMPANGIGQAVSAAMASPYWNPEPLRDDKIRHLLECAYRGDPV